MECVLKRVVQPRFSSHFIDLFVDGSCRSDSLGVENARRGEDHPSTNRIGDTATPFKPQVSDSSSLLHVTFPEDFSFDMVAFYMHSSKELLRTRLEG